MNRKHQKWARFMTVEATKNIRRETADLDKADGLEASYVPDLSLIPRKCPTCKKIALYRLTRMNIKGYPFVYHIWTCAVCMSSLMIATDEDGKELPYKKLPAVELP